MQKRHLLKLINFWPPYFGAGIRVKNISQDLTVIDVEMKMRFWNRNYVGVHFGGSLYSMTDPFLMLMLMEQLGRGYVVWDKAASIKFKRPGKGTVRARFEMPLARVAEIRAQADREPKVEPVFVISVLDEEGTLVAEVEKRLHVRKKQ